jgi:methionine aminotransferase
MFINTFPWRYPPLLSNIALKKSYRRILARNRNTSNCRGYAIFTTIQALVKANDEVIILDPSYDCYEAPILYAMQFQCAFH